MFACVPMLVDCSVISSFCWLMRLVSSAARVESILKPRSSGWTMLPVRPDWNCGLRRLIDGLAVQPAVRPVDRVVAAAVEHVLGEAGRPRLAGAGRRLVLMPCVVNAREVGRSACCCRSTSGSAGSSPRRLGDREVGQPRRDARDGDVDVLVGARAAPRPRSTDRRAGRASRTASAARRVARPAAAAAAPA